MTFRSLLRGFALVCVLATPDSSAQIAQYTFGTTGNNTAAAETVAPNAIASLFSVGPGIVATGYVAGNPGSAFNTNSYGAAFDPTDYVEATVSANPGFVLDLTQFAAEVYRSGTGPQNVEIRTSVDNYAAPITAATIPLATTWQVISVTLTGAAYQGLSSITVRIYAYGATGTTPANGTLRFDNVTLSGAVTPVGGAETASVSFSPTSATVTEGGQATVNVVLAIANDTGAPGLNAPLSGEVVVASGPAADVQFTGTFTFPAGSASGSTVPVAITAVDNDLPDGTRIVTFGFDNVTGGTAAGSFTLTILDDEPAPPIYISEMDADQVGTDTGEFVELAGTPGQSLDGLRLVLVNGNGIVAYATTSLDGQVMGANGTFLVCYTLVSPACNLTVGGSIQNGGAQGDAVALYAGAVPNPISTVGLVDALVYNINTTRDVALLTALGQTNQFFERTTASLARLMPAPGVLSELFYNVTPSPGAPNPARVRVDATAQVADVPGYRFLGVPGVDGPGVFFDVDDLAAINLVQGVPAGASNPPQYPLAGDNLFTGYDGTGTSAGFVPAASTDEPLPPGRGLAWYFYDQDITPPANHPDFGPGTSVSYALANPLFQLALDAIPVDDRLVGGPYAITAPQLNADGFYLVANPFAYPVRLGGAAVSTGLLSTAFSVWDPAANGGDGGYVTRIANPDNPFAGDALAVWQGAFAEVTGAAAAPTFAVSSDYADPTSTESLIGRTAAEAGVVLELTGTLASGARVADFATRVRLLPDATDGWDRHDGSEPTPFVPDHAQVALVGSRDGEPRRQAVLSLPDGPTTTRTIPLALTSSGAGTFALAWTTTLPDGWSAQLRDLVTGAVTVMGTSGSVGFTADASPWTNRFELVLGSNLVGAEGGTPVALRVGEVAPNPTRGAASLRLEGTSGRLQVALVDVLGRQIAVVHDAEVAAGTDLNLTLPTSGLAPGAYLVRIQNGDVQMFRRVTVAR